MNKAVKMVAMVVVLTIITTLSIASVALASNYDGPYSPGPAPESGDGTPDGPDRWGDARPDGSGPGSAPNSGDGIPDGPGW